MGPRGGSRGFMGAAIEHVAGDESAVPLAPGSCYLIKEKKPDLSYRLFTMLTRAGTPGMVITRQYPERVRRGRGPPGGRGIWARRPRGRVTPRQYRERVRGERSLPEGRIIWLSPTPGEDYHNPTAVGSLAKLISGFVEENQGVAAILLDGIEYLSINNGFLQTLMFVEHVNEFVMQRQAIVILPVSPDALEEKELALLERNIEVVESPAVKMDLETREVSKLLDGY